jgi:hypothetical protein
MPLGTVAQIDMMKAVLMNYDAYEKAEMEIFWPIHHKEVDLEKKANWGLIRCISSIGTDT